LSDAPRLGLGTKLSYGFGSIGEGLFQRGYEYFAFLYYVAVLGMSPLLGGVAILASTILDAVTDPLVGSISDKLQSQRFGRRHPFMYLSILPFAGAWYLLLTPPPDLDGMGLFWWFFVFSVLMRQALTLYQVPHAALGAELSDDYHERTSIATWRVAQSMIGTFGVIAIFTYLFFPETAEFADNGLRNPAGYPKVAFWGAVIIAISIGLSALGTQGRVPWLAQPAAASRRLALREVMAEIGIALKNPSFRSLIIGTILFVTSFSISEIFNQFVRIYFWGLTSKQTAALALPAMVGFFCGLPAAGMLHRRFDKKPTVIVASLVPALMMASLVSLRLLGVLPADISIVLPALWAVTVAAALSAGVAFISAVSMLGDVAQEVRFTSGRDITGVMFAGYSFAQKFASALAHFFASAMLEALAIPKGTAVAELAPRTVQFLGMSALVATAFSLAGIAFYLGYRIDRQRHLEISLGLVGGVAGGPSTDPRRTAEGAPVPAPVSVGG